jgi:hypothetical protein
LMRHKLRRLERAARGKLGSFMLEDGSRSYFDPTSAELFLHWCDCLRAGSAHNWPPPPEVVRKLCEAKDVQGALEQVRGKDSFGTFVYDPEVLINERRLEPRGLVSRRDPETGEWYVRDPYDEGAPEDLSEQAHESREDGV